MDTDNLRFLYEVEKKSIPDIAEATGFAISTVRKYLLLAGISLRSRADGIRAARNKLNVPRMGRVLTEEHREALRQAAIARGDQNAKGFYEHNGYVNFTRGEHKGRSVSVVKMEQRIGRKLLEDEVVHHIDGDRSNNDDNNLALVTMSGHARLHRHEDILRGFNRERKPNGRFT